MARFPDRCGRPPSELHERAKGNLCSAKWKAKAENALFYPEGCKIGETPSLIPMPGWLTF